MEPVGLGIYSGTLQSCLLKSHFEKTPQDSRSGSLDALGFWGYLSSYTRKGSLLLWCEAPFVVKAFCLGGSKSHSGLLLWFTGQGGLPARASFRVISASPVLVFSLWPHCASDLYLTSGDLDAGDAVSRGGRAPCWWLLLCCPGPYCSTTVMPARGPAVCSSPFARTFGRCQDANLLACHV